MNKKSTFPDLDPELLLQAQSGCETSLESVFRTFEKPIYHLIFRICQHPEEAMEVLQETFLLAFRKLHQYQGNAPFGVWLRKIAVNQCMSRMRRWRIREFGQRHELAALPDQPEMQLDLAKAFSRLPLETRTVVWLYDVEGYSHQEIADLFGKSISFSKTQLSRAHQKMRDWLQPDSEVPECPPFATQNI